GISEAVLLKDEQIPGESFFPGDRVKVLVTEVHRDAESAGIVTLSRTHPNMVKRLFELIVPEIHDGTVIIKTLVREAGTRTKIAVYSRDEAVDPVGACIGPSSSRIFEVINELRGEKVDVVRYSEVPEEFITSALSPATILSVEFDGEKSAKVFVGSDQLSLAIGKEGQNARLAARLTGYKIDIKGIKRRDPESGEDY
ncbi:MAG: transcription termination/antitermination protein NusA, partial [Clostridia bacterium]|nr:transcription termination/antitermination protein NusA [Clostridia bacterium]